MLVANVKLPQFTLSNELIISFSWWILFIWLSIELKNFAVAFTAKLPNNVSEHLTCWPKKSLIYKKKKKKKIGLSTTTAFKSK